MKRSLQDIRVPDIFFLLLLPLPDSPTLCISSSHVLKTRHIKKKFLTQLEMQILVSTVCKAQRLCIPKYRVPPTHQKKTFPNNYTIV